MSDLVIRFGGEGGEGVMSTGEFITRVFSRCGYHAHTFRTNPAEIKGGHACFQVRVGKETLLSAGDHVDVLLAFNQEAYDRHRDRIDSQGLLLYNSNETEVSENGANVVGLPLVDIAVESAGAKLMKNTVAVGVLAGFLKLPLEVIEEMIKEKWARKGEKIVDGNIKALHAGAQYAADSMKVESRWSLPKLNVKEERLFISGNEALALGALAAGCNFFAGYPITPASSVMEWLAKYLPKYGGTMLQMEDEISAITAVLGASFSGAKSMTATSGPGMSLIIEALGLGIMCEVPCVIVDVMRGGPSTGLPTKVEQSDLNLAVYGGHGDAPRPVIALSSVTDCFYGMIRAFNLSERLQSPVIVLSDQAMSTRNLTVPRYDLDRVTPERRIIPKSRSDDNGGNGGSSAEYKRYLITMDGVSPVSLPGTKGYNFVATGLEHDEFGAPNYEPQVHTAMLAKRERKLEMANGTVEWAPRYGDDSGDVGVLGWGGTEGTIREGVALAQEAGHKVPMIHPRLISPLPDKYLKKFYGKCKKVLVPELNHGGQFFHYLRSHYPEVKFVSMTKCDGMPFTAREIFNGIRDASR